MTYDVPLADGSKEHTLSLSKFSRDQLKEALAVMHSDSCHTLMSDPYMVLAVIDLLGHLGIDDVKESIVTKLAGVPINTTYKVAFLHAYACRRMGRTGVDAFFRRLLTDVGTDMSRFRRDFKPEYNEIFSEEKVFEYLITQKFD